MKESKAPAIKLPAPKSIHIKDARELLARNWGHRSRFSEFIDQLTDEVAKCSDTQAIIFPAIDGNGKPLPELEIDRMRMAFNSYAMRYEKQYALHYAKSTNSFIAGPRKALKMQNRKVTKP